MKRYSMPSHMPDEFPFIDRKMWKEPKMDIVKRLNDGSQCFCSIRKEAADEIERLREILRKIKWDIDQAQWPEELCLHWIDDVNSALQQNEAQILATNKYEAEGRN